MALIRSLVACLELTACDTAASDWVFRVKLSVSLGSVAILELLCGNLSLLRLGKEAEVVNLVTGVLDCWSTLSDFREFNCSARGSITVAADAASTSLEVLSVELLERQKLVIILLVVRVVAEVIDILFFWSNQRDRKEAVHLGLLRELSVANLTKDGVEAEHIL